MARSKVSIPMARRQLRDKISHISTTNVLYVCIPPATPLSQFFVRSGYPKAKKHLALMSATKECFMGVQEKTD